MSKQLYALNTTPILIYKCRIDKLDGLPSVPSVRVGIRSQGFNSERTHCDVMKFFSRALLCDLFFHFFPVSTHQSHPLEVGGGKVVFHG